MKPLTWRALFAILLAMFATALGYGIVLPILPFLIEQLGGEGDAATLSQHTGLLSGTYTLALFLFAPLWGTISDKRRRRQVLLLGLIGSAVALGLFTLVQSLPMLYIGRFLSGLFAAAITPTAYALVGDYALSKASRAHRFALINVASTTGFFVGPLVGGLVLSITPKLPIEGVNGAFVALILATSGSALAAAFMVWLLVPAAVQRQQLRDAGAEKQSDRRAMLRLWEWEDGDRRSIRQ